MKPLPLIRGLVSGGFKSVPPDWRPSPWHLASSHQLLRILPPTPGAQPLFSPFCCGSVPSGLGRPVSSEPERTGTSCLGIRRLLMCPSRGFRRPPRPSQLAPLT
ncbi:hypothetical protein AAFF_G00295620 [Aldrovandia affinis]|uniref:Uncharacterized protein n=1 Tax=Aldrovandia affinis TaxID=143900 RepID=A0AAD7WRE5_9TELE|nr:hypothetical protein AAFF_G00295620 [Aldrovandia affinis]